MLGRRAPNVVTTERGYEAATGRLSAQRHALLGASVNAYAYAYTERGNIGAIAEEGQVSRTKAYSYDELERLTEVDVPALPEQAEAYALDPEGNRLSSQRSSAHETDAANRLRSDDTYSYTYDLNGNLTGKTAKPGTDGPDWAYAYDALDQLVAVRRDGAVVERYRYDAFGRRSRIETANDNDPDGSRPFSARRRPRRLGPHARLGPDGRRHARAPAPLHARPGRGRAAADGGVRRGRHARSPTIY